MSSACVTLQPPSSTFFPQNFDLGTLKAIERWSSFNPTTAARTEAEAKPCFGPSNPSTRLRLSRLVLLFQRTRNYSQCPLRSLDLGPRSQARPSKAVAVLLIGQIRLFMVRVVVKMPKDWERARARSKCATGTWTSYLPVIYHLDLHSR